MIEKSHKKTVSVETGPELKIQIERENHTATLVTMSAKMTEKSHRKIVNEETELGQKHPIDQANITATLAIQKMEEMNCASDIATLLYIFTMERILRIQQQTIQLKSC